MATHLEDRLRSLSDRVLLPDPGVADRVVAHVVETYRAGLPASRPPRVPIRGRRRRSRLAALVAIAVAVGAATLVIQPFSGDGRLIDPAAAAALHRAAITAAHQPALPPLLPGRYYHFRDTELGWIEQTTVPGSYTSCATSCPPPPADWAAKARVTTETWVGADGAGLRVATVGRATFRSAAVRRTWRRMYGFPVSHPFGLTPPDRLSRGQHTFGWGLTYRELRHLPSDPAKLAGMVRREATPSSQASHPDSANRLNFEEFQVVGDIMRDSPLKPRVRAAFYTILSRLPGVEFDGRVTDPLGRPGIQVSISRSSDEPPSILIFDPRTAQLLSEGGGGYSGWSVVDSIPHR